MTLVAERIGITEYVAQAKNVYPAEGAPTAEDLDGSRQRVLKVWFLEGKNVLFNTFNQGMNY